MKEPIRLLKRASGGSTVVVLVLMLILVASISVAQESQERGRPNTLQAISVTKTAGRAQVTPGSAVSYTVVLGNSDPNDVLVTEISDILPPPFQYVGLAAGSEIVDEPSDSVEPEITWQGRYTVPAAGSLQLRYWVWVPREAQPAFTPYTNTVTVRYSETVLGSATEGVLVVGPDVRVEKRVSPGQVTVGNPVTFTVLVQNVGNGMGVVTRISDVLPSDFRFLGMVATSTITTPPDGVTGTIVWQGPFTLSASTALTLAYQAWAGRASDSALINRVVAIVGDTGRSAEAPVQVEPCHIFIPAVTKNWKPATFEMAKQASSPQVAISDLVTYTVTVNNTGSEVGHVDQILDTLPQGFTFDSMAAGSDIPALPTVSTGTLVWTGPFTVASLSNLNLVYRVRVHDVPGVYTNTVTATTHDAIPPREPAQAAVTVMEPIYLWEDFESGTDGWEPFLNYWRLKPEQWYLQAGTGVDNSTGLRHTYWKGWEGDPGRGAHDALYMYRGAGAEQWTDYRLEGWVKMDKGSKMGFWVRGKYFPDVEGTHVEGYYIDWRPNRPTDGVEIWSIKNSGGTAFHFSDPELIAVGPASMTLGHWYHLAVEVEGDHIRVFVDGTQVLDHVDDRWSEGTVGLFAYKVEYGTWDNILVTPLDR